MKVRRLLIPLLAFAAGLGGTVLWSTASGGSPLKDGKAPEFSPLAAGTVKPMAPEARTGTGKPLPVPVDADPVPVPTLEEVLQATGLGRILLMTRFIQTATEEQLEKMCRQQARPSDPFPPEIIRLLWARRVEMDPEVVLRPPPPPTPLEEPWLALARLDPLKAMTLSSGEPQKIRAAILSLLARSDPALARKFLAETPALDLAFQTQVNQALFFSGMGTDPVAAMTEALKKRDNQFGHVLGDWLRVEPDAARAWMAGITGPADRLLVQDAAFHSRLKTDPAGAVAEAEALPAGQTRTARLTEALTALARQDPAAARAWAESIPAPAIRQRALAAIADALVPANPAAAVDILRHLNWGEWSQSGGNESVLNESRPSLSGTKIRDDLLAKLMAAAPQATVGALVHSGNAAAAPIGEAMKNWLALQPEEASAWLRDAPSGPGRDLGIRAITAWLTAGQLLPPDYPAALEWAATSSTSDQRKEDTLRLATQWAGLDSGAARAGVEALPLPEEEKAPILRRLEELKIKIP